MLFIVALNYCNSETIDPLKGINSLDNSVTSQQLSKECLNRHESAINRRHAGQRSLK